LKKQREAWVYFSFSLPKVKLKNFPTRSEVNEWCNAHSSLIAANPMYAIRKFYNWIFEPSKPTP
jgi:hypothetical protein